MKIEHDILGFKNGDSVLWYDKSYGDYLTWCYWHLKNEFKIFEIIHNDTLYRIGECTKWGTIKSMHWRGDYWLFQFSDKDQCHWLM